MHRSAVEEAALPQDSNKPQLELPAPTPQSETREQEATAVVPTGADVIEGEVIVLDQPEMSEDHVPPKRKPYWVCIPCTIILCLAFLASSFLVPFFTPVATIIIIPIEQTITTTAAVQVQGRQLAPLSLSQSATVPATGKRHQAAARAHGTITFYNGLFVSQTIAAGTILTASNGVQIVTDQPAAIPAGNPPGYGLVTAPAHALRAGSQGNIPASDINQACCATSVLAKNTTAFTGGSNARGYLVVTGVDIDTAIATLQTILAKSEQAALQVQLNLREGLITPRCNKQVHSDHQVGEETKAVTVTVAETCSAIAYDTHTLHYNTTQMISKEAVSRLGTGYSLMSDLQVHILYATITDRARGIATLTVNLAATYVYQLSPGQKQHLIRLIAGQSPQQAMNILLQVPGIQRVHILTSSSAHQTLPADPTGIQIVLLYQSTP
jgi:hypothetical protein